MASAVAVLAAAAAAAAVLVALAAAVVGVAVATAFGVEQLVGADSAIELKDDADACRTSGVDHGHPSNSRFAAAAYR